MCCEAIEKVFYDDVVGEVSLEVSLEEVLECM